MHAQRSPRTQAHTKRLFGPYELTHKLAVGGSAEVFLGRIRGNLTAPPLVIKRLLGGTHHPGQVDILMREAALHRNVLHPNVVRILDAGSVEDEPYIAMEYVPGLDLCRLLRRSSSTSQAIPAGLAVFIARSIADALSAVHNADLSSKKLIHGDIAPSNIYLSHAGEVKLGDFGIARLCAGGDGTQEPRPCVGHFGYIAPELLRGEAHDHRVDIFALAVVLSELLIGRSVFPGSGQLAISLSIRDGNIEPLRHAAATLPPGLFEVCEQALRSNPSERTASAGAFSEALRPFQDASDVQLSKSLGSWVTWAQDNDKFIQDIGQRVLESVSVMRAVSRSSSGIQALSTLTRSDTPIESSPSRLGTEESMIRRAGRGELIPVAFPRLIEMIATGELQSHDEVALWGAPFQPVGEIEELARHVLPSTSSTTAEQFAPGPPDFVADLADTSLLSVLGRLRYQAGSTALFIMPSRRHTEERTDVYISEGRLLQVSWSGCDEALGQTLLAQGLVEPAALDRALAKVPNSNMALDEVLLRMKLIEPVDVLQALRTRSLSHLASLCEQSQGQVQIYQNGSPQQMLFSLDLDLITAMMSGALSSGPSLPMTAVLYPGDRAPEAGSKASPLAVLNRIPLLAQQNMQVETAISELSQLDKSTTQSRASAALKTALALKWIRCG